ncbi:MAG: hypothetical protein AAGB00_11910 [Planctomycetota bacterium]
MSRKRRTKDYIDPEVQGALARRLVLQWTLFLVAAAALAFALEWMSNPFMPVRQTLADAWWTYGPLLLVLVCLAPIFVFDAIKLSNRFTGPVHRLRQVTRSLAEGETPGNIEFRGADFWKDLAGDFNRVVDRLAKSEGATNAKDNGR